MKILFDQGTPVPLRHHLPAHTVNTAFEQGWSELKNGDLLNTAEHEGYELFVTTDQNLRYQQNFSDRRLAILVLMSTSWPRIRLKVEEIQTIVSQIRPGEYREISI